MDPRLSFWTRWLLIACGLITLFGMIMALFSGTAIFRPFDHQIDPVFWGDEHPPAAASSFARWVYGVWGATIVGWGICLLAMTWFALKARQRWAWSAMVLALLIWFSLDTALSLLAGVIFNVLFNTVVLVALGIPLLALRREFGSL